MSTGALELREDGDALVFAFKGRLDAESTGQLWKQAFEGFEQKKPRRIIIDAAAVDYCDGSGIGLIVELRRRQGKDTEIRGLAGQFKSLLDLFPFEESAPPLPKPGRVSWPVEVGKGTTHVLDDLRKQVAFTGELLVNLARALTHPREIRWRDALAVADAAGVNA